MSRRKFLRGAAAAGAAWAHAAGGGFPAAADHRAAPSKAHIAITLDLEMSRHYPKRGMTEWDYEKGNLDDATKQFAVEAGQLVKAAGGRIHFFCVGRVLEQPQVDWLKDLAAAGHPIGNHTYDHVNVLAATPEQTQYRFQRAPWLIRGQTTLQLLEENIRLTTIGLKQRCAIEAAGFRTPGGFASGLEGREDIQRLVLNQGFSWVSSKYPAHDAGRPMQPPGAEVFASIVKAQAAAQPFRYNTGLVEVPMSPISDVNAFRTNFWKLEDFLKATRLSVEWAIEHRAAYDFLGHPSCLLVEDPKFETIKLICRLVQEAAGRAEIVDLGTIAARVA
jgi:peptidoglycan/xylan/chitin deacetylase (PgdA/CDA1 family)